MSEFFVGYLPKVPAGILRILRRTILALTLGTAVLAAVMVKSQHSFPASIFEFGKIRDFQGTIEQSPYPSLLVSHPGGTAGRDYSRSLLVAVGKHGADEQVAPLAGKLVKLKGTLIYRGSDTAIEVMPNSIVATGESPVTTSPIDLGPVTLTGEIVDTKCYLGVMNPGEGKVHRDCATRCLSGGIPPAFMVRQADGNQVLYVLTGPDGKRVPANWGAERAAQLATLRGHLVKADNILIFKADLESFQLAGGRRVTPN